MTERLLGPFFRRGTSVLAWKWCSFTPNLDDWKRQPSHGGLIYSESWRWRELARSVHRPRIPEKSDLGWRARDCPRQARAARCNGDGYRQDAHLQSAVLPTAEDGALSSDSVFGRPQCFGQTDRRRAERPAAGKSADAIPCTRARKARPTPRCKGRSPRIGSVPLSR